MAGNESRAGRSVVSKISTILTVVRDGHAETLTEIAARSGMPLSTVHRLATELAAWGLLDRDDEGRFRADGPPAGPAGEDSPLVPATRLREHIAPVLADLFRVTGMHARAGFLAGPEVAYFEKVSGHLPVTALSAFARLPAHATALGKVVLAFSPAGTVDLVLARGLRRFTGETITQPARLRWALRRIRLAGVAFCDRELDEQWSGVAAPVFGPGGKVVAAIELRVPDLVRGACTVQAPLTVATACLSRELAVARYRPQRPLTCV